jgi:hypothetical protein
MQASSRTAPIRSTPAARRTARPRLAVARRASQRDLVALSLLLCDRRT